MAVKGFSRFVGAFLLCVFGLVLLGGSGGQAAAEGLAGVEAYDLRVEGVVEPLAVDNPEPQFSWKLKSDGRAVFQKAFRVKVWRVVSDNCLVEIWDSGIIYERTAAVTYGGEALQDDCVYSWSVYIWDEDEVTRGQGFTSCFTTGYVQSIPFTNAKFVGVQDEDISEEAPAIFVKNFNIPQKPVRQVLFRATAIGMYDFAINGKRGSQDEFKPGWSNYNKRVFYGTYDVTDCVDCGSNDIAIALGGGYALNRIAHETYNYDRPWLIAEVVICFEDGEVQLISTDESWGYRLDGQLSSADIYDGEVLDARRPSLSELSSNCAMDCDKVEVTTFDLEFSSWLGAGVRVQHSFSKKPNASFPLKLDSGETVVLDLGQNMAFLPYFRVLAEEGTALTFRFSEMLDSGDSGDGLYLDNLRSAQAKVDYIARGENDEYQSVFSYFGGRYVSVSASNDCILEDFEARCLSLTGEMSGEIVTDNERINRLFLNIQWSQRSNWQSVATDCPQRDERLPWMGDLRSFAKTSLYNADLYAFYAKWCKDLVDSQMDAGDYPSLVPYNKITGSGAAGWSDGGIEVPCALYRHYGDVNFVRSVYDSMKKYMGWIVENDKAQGAYTGARPVYGDWLAYEETDPTLISTAIYARNAACMTEMAAAIGEVNDALHYAVLYTQIRNSFRERYLVNGELSNQTQTAYLLSLNFNLLDRGEREVAAEALRESIIANGCKLATGFVGTPLLLPTLSNIGAGDIAYRLLFQDESPSWLYSVDQGATTIWERWNSYVAGEGFSEDGMNSFNHFIYGCVGEWMYEKMLGLRIDATNSSYQYVFSPEEIPDEIEADILSECSGETDTTFGKVRAKWKRTAAGRVFELDIPANSKVLVDISLDELSKRVVLIEEVECAFEELDRSGVIEELVTNDGRVSFVLPSGKYVIA